MVGGIAGHARGVSSPPQDRDFDLHGHQRATASIGRRLSLSTLGNLKTAGAVEKQILLEAERRLDLVRAEVIQALQASKAQNQLIAQAHQQVLFGKEALRLARANFQGGTAMPLDVLHAQSIAAEARVHYAEAVAAYNQAEANLLAALGLLDIKVVEEPPP